MATATREIAPVAPLVEQVGGDRLYRISLDQYHRMAEAGILTEYDPVVLLDGLLVTKMTKGNPHVTSVELGQKALDRALPAGWHVGKEDAVALPAGPTGRDSEPEPDITVIRGEIRDYAARKPLPADVALIVEVADSSLAEDRRGLVRYAWAAIPTAWIVNLSGRNIEVYTEPTGPDDKPRYLALRTFGEGDEVPLLLDGREVGRVAVRDLLP